MFRQVYTNQREPEETRDISRGKLLIKKAMWYELTHNNICGFILLLNNITRIYKFLIFIMVS